MSICTYAPCELAAAGHELLTAMSQYRAAIEDARGMSLRQLGSAVARLDGSASPRARVLRVVYSDRMRLAFEERRRAREHGWIKPLPQPRGTDYAAEVGWLVAP